MICRCLNFVPQPAKYQALRYIRSSLVLLICTLLLFSIKAGAEDTEYQAEAYRTSIEIKIDGILDEADWQKANSITQFVQVEPDEGEAITQPMEVRVLYDDKNIYFGYTCYDSDISKWSPTKCVVTHAVSTKTIMRSCFWIPTMIGATPPSFVSTPLAE